MDAEGKPAARQLRSPEDTTGQDHCTHNVCGSKRAPGGGCSVQLTLERGPLVEITDSSLRPTKTFLKEGTSKAEATLCQLAVFMASDFPSSPTMNN